MSRDNYTGRQQALYDDLQAVLRAHDYDDTQAEKLMQALEEDPQC